MCVRYHPRPLPHNNQTEMSPLICVYNVPVMYIVSINQSVLCNTGRGKFGKSIKVGQTNYCIYQLSVKLVRDRYQ